MIEHRYSEGRLRTSLARVTTVKGETLGTAFVVAPGIALTCNHVLSARDTVALQLDDGRQVDCRITNADRFPAVDVARICFAGHSPLPLPVETDHEAVDDVRSLGFHYGGYGIEGPFPFAGRIAGRTGPIRYEHERVYIVDRVLRIKDDQFDSGMSGAPLVDATTGVGIGIVNAKLTIEGQSGGFAVPFAEIGASAPDLADLLAANRRAVPRYGAFINFPGALEVCRDLRREALEWLIARGLLLPQYHVSRQKVETTIKRFLESDTRCLAVVGDAGVGKTQLLGSLATSQEDWPTVLLLGRAMRPDVKDLSEALQQMLDEAKLAEAASVDAIAGTCSEVGTEMLFLLDGLNELSGVDRELVSRFIDRSVRWLEARHARLILTSRPEVWETIKHDVPHSCFFRPRAEIAHKDIEPKIEEIEERLSDFDEAEAILAQAQYGLVHRDTVPLISHPLLLRIFAGLGANLDSVRSVHRIDAYECFVAEKCARIAAACGIARRAVRHRLDEVARTTLEEGDLRLSCGRFFALCADDRLASCMLNEYMLIEIGNGFRFAFDEVGEYLQASHISPANEFEALARSGSCNTGALSFRLLQDERENCDRTVDALTHVVARCTGAAFIELSRIFTLLLGESTAPSAYVGAIRRFAERIVEVIQSSVDPPVVDLPALRQTIATSRLSVAERIAILHRFTPLADPYDFEPSHWDYHDGRYLEGCRQEWTASGDLAHSISFVIEAAPARAFAELIKWFDDRAHLQDHRATVSTLAAALLLLHRHLAFDELTDMLAKRSSNPLARRLLAREFTERDPDRMLTRCTAWWRQDTPPLQYAAAMCLRAMSHHPQPKRRVRRMGNLLLRILAAYEPGSAEWAGIAGALVRLPGYDSEVAAGLVDQFLANNRFVVGSEIAPLLLRHEALVLKTLDAYLSSPNLQASRFADAVRACIEFYRSIHLGRFAELLNTALDRGVHPDLLALSLEQLCRVAEDEESENALRQLVARFVRQASPRGRCYLAYYAAAALRPGERSALACYVLRLLLEHETDTENLLLLASKLVERLDHAEDDRMIEAERAALAKIRDKVDIDRFEWTIFHAAHLNYKASENLADVYRRGLIKPGQRGQRFVSALDSGKPARDAIERVFRY